MQQRQLRLGDILDDYCPRERRVTNHAVVAMVGADVKQTRCTTCDAEHEYKAAKIPRLRRKTETPAALAAPGIGSIPKIHEPDTTAKPGGDAAITSSDDVVATITIDETLDVADAGIAARAAGGDAASEDRDGAGRDADDALGDSGRDEGPVHRPLIRASLPRTEGQPPPQRPATDFTIRQPAGRQNRFRARHQQGGGGQFQGNRDKGGFGGASRGGPRQGGRPPQGGMDRQPRRNDSGRKRSR